MTLSIRPTRTVCASSAAVAMPAAPSAIARTATIRIPRRMSRAYSQLWHEAYPDGHPSAIDVPVGDVVHAVLRAPQLDQMSERGRFVFDGFKLAFHLERSQAQPAAGRALEIAVPVRGTIGAQPYRSVFVGEPQPHRALRPRPPAARDEDKLRLGDSPREVVARHGARSASASSRSEEHTSELQSRGHLVCRLLLEKKRKNN